MCPIYDLIVEKLSEKVGNGGVRNLVAYSLCPFTQLPSSCRVRGHAVTEADVFLAALLRGAQDEVRKHDQSSFQYLM